MTTARRPGFLSFCFALFAAALVPGQLGGCSHHLVREPEYAATFAHGAVAADHAVASRAGAEMLRKGGNAVDAAVATSFCLSVVRPESCGIGGGGFMVIHFSDEGLADQRQRGRSVPRDVALNYREMCPWGIGPDYYEKDTDPHASTHGSKAVGIPGTVAGLLTALDRYGTLDRETVLAPAILAAEVGFTADQHFVAAAKSVMKDFEKNPTWKERFRFVWVRFCREGKIKVGDVIKLPEQAAALRLIAEQGAAAFYSGPIAQAMAETIRRDGGVLNTDDLGKYQVSSTEPLRFQAFGRTFVTMPPPSSGGVAIAETMGILERTLHRVQPSFDWQHLPTRGNIASSGPFIQASPGDHDTMYSPSLIYAHALAESFKHAFADRAEWLADPAFAKVPVETLLSSEYLDARAAAIDMSRTRDPQSYGTQRSTAGATDDHGTSHLSVVDTRGNAVACTETINLEFGSSLAVDSFGFVLNNQMDDFTTRRGRPNSFKLTQSDRNLPQPGKRPLSSMSPTVVLEANHKVDVVAGASGGPRIISGTLHAMLNTTLHGAPAWAAVSMPRFHHQWSPDVISFEPALFDYRTQPPLLEHSLVESPEFVIAMLQDFGHRVERAKDDVGNVQLIARDPRGGWQAACDPRKGGRPAGY